MKQKSLIFIVLCMVICLIPSVGMFFFPTTQTTENRPMAAAPQLFTEEGSLNKSFISDFESYFTEHMALRNQMVYADAMVQTKVFQESNVSGVISGTDGWLYYSSTLDDYLGLKPMSDRELFNLAHNFSVVQEYAETRDLDFVLTIAPNKNTLYGEHMPYYKDYKVDTRHNAIELAEDLAREQIHYLNLFEAFEAQDQVLYLKRDSHWDNRGACLAYNGIMDVLGMSHEEYANRAPEIVKHDHGDLKKLLYSFYGELEENYDYGLSQDYTYGNDAKSVEDGWIITENPAGEGKLLMFRDSFANTLIPFLSNEFAQAYYSKGMPNALERFVETYEPDSIVIQKVERNISEYLENPPILTPPEAVLPAAYSIAATDSTIEIAGSMNDANYYVISGNVDERRMAPDSEILVWVDGHTYRAYHTEENGYLLYLKKAAFADASAAVEVYAVNGNTCTQVLAAQIQLPQ